MILVAGNINYDVLFPLDRLPEPHEKLQCPNAVTGFGGSAANTAWWLARMGLPVTLAGAVGTDLFGKSHLAELERTGIRVAGVDCIEGVSGLAVMFSLGTEKRMVRTPGANMHGRFHPELLEGCRLVYLSGNCIPALAGYAKAASDNGIPVVCGWHGASDGHVAAMASGYILNADEARMITGLADPEESIKALDADFAAVTLPSGGCVLSRGIEVQVVPAPELEPVDRTGGGDAFAAVLLAGIYLKIDLRESAVAANMFAAEVIMNIGARPEIQPPKELSLDH